MEVDDMKLAWTARELEWTVVKRGYDDENDEVKCRVAVQAEMVDGSYDDER